MFSEKNDILVSCISGLSGLTRVPSILITNYMQLIFRTANVTGEPENVASFFTNFLTDKLY